MRLPVPPPPQTVYTNAVYVHINFIAISSTLQQTDFLTQLSSFIKYKYYFFCTGAAGETGAGAGSAFCGAGAATGAWTGAAFPLPDIIEEDEG